MGRNMPCCSRRLIVAIEIRQRRITSARDKKQSSIGFISICYT